MSEVVLIADRARSLAIELENLAVLGGAAQQLAELQHRRDKLQRELARLRPPILFLRTAREFVSGVPDLQSPDVESALRLLGTTSTAFAKDPRTIAGTEFASTLQAVKKAVETTERYAQVVWHGLAQPVCSEMRTELLHALSRVPVWHEVVVRIQALQSRIADLAAMPLVSRDQFLEFFKLAAERNNAWQSLQGDGGIPDAVVQFLRASVGEGVPLNAVTNEVLGWLRERDIEQYFRVRL